MPKVLDRNTLADFASRDTIDYPDPPYLEIVPGSPNDVITETVPQKYRVLEGDVLREMNAAEKQVVDDAELADTQAKGRDDAKTASDVDEGVGYQNRGLIGTFNQRDNYNTNRIEEIYSTLAAIKASTGPADSIRDAIPASFLPTETRDRDEAIKAYEDIIDVGGAEPRDPAAMGNGRGRR